MQQDSGAPLSELKADDGMTGRRLLMPLAADLLDLRVVAIGLEEVSALGAAYMAGLGIGVFEGLADLNALPRDQIIFEPSGSVGRIQEDYEIWRRMIHKHC